MAVASAQATIRGIDVDKLAKGFADEEFVFKNFLTVSPTSAREIRWYQKTAGTLTGVATTGIAGSVGMLGTQLSLPSVQEASWTRNTSVVRKYIVESPWLSYEDLSDADPDILATNIRDLTRAVANQVDQRIYSILSGSMLLSGAGMGSWTSGSVGNPILDLLSGSAQIRLQSYDVSNLKVLVHPTDYKNLLNYVITLKGSSIPAFASDKAQSGVLMRLVGQDIVVSANATLGMAVQIVPQRVATWKNFTDISAGTIDNLGVGKKIRVWTEGEVLLTDPNAGFVIKGIV